MSENHAVNTVTGYQCPLCEEIYKTEEEARQCLESHEINKSGRKHQKYQCPVCDTVYDDLESAEDCRNNHDIKEKEVPEDFEFTTIESE